MSLHGNDRAGLLLTRDTVTAGKGLRDLSEVVGGEETLTIVNIKALTVISFVFNVEHGSFIEYFHTPQSFLPPSFSNNHLKGSNASPESAW